jgi:hypothetical protein
VHRYYCSISKVAQDFLFSVCLLESIVRPSLFSCRSNIFWFSFPYAIQMHVMASLLPDMFPDLLIMFRRLRKVLSVLSDNQPPCPQFYLYSSADRVIPGECVESFMDLQRSLGRSVYAHNFVSSPHVDHYRSFPHVYSAKIDEFLKICSTVKVS